MEFEQDTKNFYNVQSIGNFCANIDIENVNNANIIVQKDLQDTRMSLIKGVE